MGDPAAMDMRGQPLHALQQLLDGEDVGVDQLKVSGQGLDDR